MFSPALALRGQAPDEIEWIRQFGTAATDAAGAVSVDATGVYVAGHVAPPTVDGQRLAVLPYKASPHAELASGFFVGNLV